MTIIGAQSRGAFAVSANGGIALADIAGYYFGTAGQVILAVTVTLACLKTAIGLVTSCAEIFRVLFPKSMSYKAWAIVFSVVSLLITNVGLTQIIDYSVPVLMFLYPLTITLMLLSLFGHFFDYDKRVFVSVTAFTLAAAVLDLLAALPDGARAFLHVNGFVAFCKESLPLFGIGLFWLILPSSALSSASFSAPPGRKRRRDKHFHLRRLWLPLTRELSSETRRRERKTAFSASKVFLALRQNINFARLPRQREAFFYSSAALAFFIYR